jgi:hypothetical protein
MSELPFLCKQYLTDEIWFDYKRSSNTESRGMEYGVCMNNKPKPHLYVSKYVLLDVYDIIYDSYLGNTYIV